MLLELTIRDFAIIDHLSLHFAPGFNVLTGETGAGKSIIIDALGTLRGEKTDPTFVRAGSSAARVEGIFSLDDCPELLPLLEEYGLRDDEDEHLILTREINAASGRSVARVNGRAVNTATLREIGSRLVDIHGQHEGVSLFNVRTHLEILDRFANLLPLRAEVAALVDELRQVRQQLDDLRRSEARRQERIEELRFQIEEIEGAKLRVGEEQALQRERAVLQNAARITELIGIAYALLAEGDGNEVPPIIDLLGTAVGALDDLARLDPAAAGLVEQANDVLFRLEDLSANLRDYRDRLEFDAGRMEAIEERFLLLRALQRKYHATIEELLQSVDTARQELERLTHSAEHMAELEAREAALIAHLAARAGELSRRRRAAGDELSRRIEQSMSDLAMPHVRFQVQIEQAPDPRGVPYSPDATHHDGRAPRVACDKTGIDRVEFLIAPNPGEPLKPLARIASGGESARLLLAMKSILSLVDSVPALVFDEIDVGVGGRAGSVVGEKLWAMTGNHQVLCITHLPQVAAFADAHFTIRKEVADGRTRSIVTLLDDEQRVDELAAMLDGVPISEASRQSARAMLERAATFKRERGAQVRGDLAATHG
ncbi:DNA repair protein RecN [Kallotenue papyrolyticum]|uniref:DNA repair protein RecN n=1 Tax=Kallotenue papyrolyticum TaxID=1325125 RepID=UPI0004924CFE|nr:DNA repair protein RecN [Kallotenue papyrolyticum]